MAPIAVADLKKLSPPVRSGVEGAMELHLRHEPTKVSKSRIKRLRGLEQPQYRLRVDQTRVFYDVHEATVEVLAIVSKAEADSWLRAHATPTKARGAGEGEG